MNEAAFYHGFVWAWVALAALIFILLFFITAPYGRFVRPGWGPTVGRTLGWVLMEAPSALLMVVFFFTGNRTDNLPAIVFLLIWQTHYLHRAFVYPFQLRGKEKRMTLVTVLMGVAFNAGNTYLNGRALFYLSPLRDVDWLWDPRFVIGFLLFTAGFILNKRADARLRALRSPGQDQYQIPRGGLFERVSAANYFGELVEWIGWALLTWSVGGLVFALWTAANLVPRARAIHLWYLKTFPDYPQNRKAVIPFLF